MAGTPRRLRPVLGLVVALSFLVAWSGTPPVVATAEARLPVWHGGIDLYRPGVFTTQKSWLWCTAAGIQIVRNIVDHQADHSVSGQRRYFDWMRAHNRYSLPLSAGVDAQGWAAGFRHFVDSRYALVASRTFDSALRLAVTRLRKTNLPVGITVSHGNHAWILTGFTATADPLRTSKFTITSVRVTGPLFGLQSRNGYDMRPDTKLTPAQLRTFFTPWRYKPKRMIWDGLFISIQPIPVVAKTAVPTKAPKATPKPTPKVAAALPSGPSASPSPSVSPSPSATAALESTSTVAPIAAAVPVDDTPRADTGTAASSTSELVTAGVVALAVLSGLAVWIVLAGTRSGPSRPGRRGTARR